MLSVIRAVGIAASALVLVGCNPSSTENARVSDTGTVTVYTVNYPLKYFAERIGGEHVDVAFPAPAGEDPAFWSPDAKTVAAYQQADIILLNGATYAKWVPKATLPDAKLVDTTKEVKDKYITVKDAVTHSHGPGKEHSHEGIAFTTWLDPEIAIAQASSVHRALVDLRPAHKSDFDQNFDSLKSDLEDLDRRLRTAINQDAADQPVVFSHPVFQYLECKYGLNARSVHWEPDSLPSDKSWAELQELLKSHPAKWMIWEGKPLDDSVQRLADLGVQSTVFDPCGNTPDEGEWLEVMGRNTDSLARVYSAEATIHANDH